MAVNLRPNYRLKGARVEKNLTQAELAKLIGMKRMTYVKKENGENPFREHEILKICEVLGKDIKDIFF